MSSHLAGRFLACCSRLLVGPPCVCLGAFGFYLNVTKQAGFRSEKLGKRQATKIEVQTMRVVTTANNSVSVVSTEEFAASKQASKQASLYFIIKACFHSPGFHSGIFSFSSFFCSWIFCALTRHVPLFCSILFSRNQARTDLAPSCLQAQLFRESF